MQHSVPSTAVDEAERCIRAHVRRKIKNFLNYQIVSWRGAHSSDRIVIQYILAKISHKMRALPAHVY